jgi:hypothetical protein
MWPYLIIAAIATVLGVMSLAGYLSRHHPALAPAPERITTVTAHVVTAHPAPVGSGPFAYDNGLAIDGPDDPDEEDP